LSITAISCAKHGPLFGMRNGLNYIKVDCFQYYQ
jgi:hypothetical protein